MTTKKGYKFIGVHLKKEDKAKILELIDAGYYTTMSGFCVEAITKHLKWTYAKLEIEAARKLIDHQDLRRKQ